MRPARYHPLLVALHWLTAASLLGLLVAGTLLLAPFANDAPHKLLSFRLHMGLGGITLILLLIRLGVRLITQHPPPAATGHPALDRLAGGTHWALYATAIAMAASGAVLSASSGLPDAVFGDGPMPPDFAAFPARAVHGLLATLLMALIVLHVAAALWHQFWRRDRLFARMWFGPR